MYEKKGSSLHILLFFTQKRQQWGLFVKEMKGEIISAFHASSMGRHLSFFSLYKIYRELQMTFLRQKHTSSSITHCVHSVYYMRKSSLRNHKCPTNCPSHFYFFFHLEGRPVLTFFHSLLENRVCGKFGSKKVGNDIFLLYVRKEGGKSYTFRS